MTGFRLPASGFRLRVAGCCAAVALCVGGAAGAAEKAEPKRKVLKLEEFTVEGRLQKPQAFFILQRNNLAFEEQEKKESFLPKIVKSCEREPF